MRIHVIGVGSPWGDDDVGLRVARRLAAGDLPPGTHALACARPFPDLLDALAGAEHAILVDAVRAGGVPGELVWLSRESLARRSAASSHGLGVARVLDLAEALGGLPRALDLLGIEIGDAPASGDGQRDAAAPHRIEGRRARAAGSQRAEIATRRAALDAAVERARTLVLARIEQRLESRPPAHREEAPHA